MTTDGDKLVQGLYDKKNKGIKFSPEPASNKPGVGFTPGWIKGSGTVSADYIIESGGETYSGSTINLSNPDTQKRLALAQAALVKSAADYKNPSQDEEEEKKKRERFFDNFSAVIHQDDIVGDYYPAVTALEDKKSNIMKAGYERILNPEEQQKIAEFENARVAKNRTTWAGLENKQIVKSDLTPIDSTNDKAEAEIIKIRMAAAERALGGEAAKVKGKFAEEIKYSTKVLSEDEQAARLTDRLEDAAAKSLLKPEEKKEYAKTEAEIKAKWDEKFSTEKDFSDAMRRHDPACGDYSSFSAVVLKRNGIRNEKINYGHCCQEGASYIGSAHSYNIIIEKRNGVDYVAGVYEGTAENNSYREVKNNITLQEFHKGETLVTFNPKSGWATYGTGKYKDGKFAEIDKECGIVASGDKIIAHDSKLIAETKIAYTNSLDPKSLTDKIYAMSQQYGINDKSIDGQVYIDMAKNYANPRLGAAFQMLQGLPARKDANEEQLQQYAKIDELLSNKDIPQKDLTKYAVTEETIAKFEQDWPAVSTAKQLHDIVNNEMKNTTPSPELLKKYPWLAETKALMNGAPSYEDALDQSINKNNHKATKAYDRLETIAMDNNVSVADLEDIRKSLQPQEKDLNVEEAVTRNGTGTRATELSSAPIQSDSKSAYKS